LQEEPILFAIPTSWTLFLHLINFAVFCLSLWKLFYDVVHVLLNLLVLLLINLSLSYFGF
jgi:hypothetical protein